MPVLPFLHFFSALAYLYLAVFILIKNPRSPLNRLCAVIFGCFMLWCIGKMVAHNPYASEALALSFMKVVVLGAWSFSAFLLWFTLIFTEKKRVLEHLYIYPLLFAVPAIAITIQWFSGTFLVYVMRPYGWGLQWQKSIFTLGLLAYFFCSIALSVGLIFHFVTKTTDPIKKKQARIIAISILVAFVIGYTTNIILPRLSSAAIPDMAHNMALLLAVGLVYAIVKYNFLIITPAMAADNIISTMADALILADPQGYIVTANKAAKNLLEYGKGELKGQHLDSLFAEQAKETEAIKKRVKQTGVRNKDIMLRSKTGKRIPVNFSSSILTGEKNTIAGIVCIARDITDQKRSENNLRQAKKEAERANRAKSEFLANMSHEFRTPLNHIIGFTEILLDKKFGDLNDKQLKYLDNVHQSSNHLLSLINDILDLSKIEAGKEELERTQVNLKQILEDSLIMVKEKAIKHNIKLSTDLDNIPEHISADERKLKQILYNLLSNAVKFTPDGGKILLKALKASQKDEKGREKTAIRISVIDNGIGMDPAVIDNIFRPFEQVDGSSSRKFQGTGLGLSLAKNLVELHGGKISAESDGKNKGSTFNFLIPIYPHD